MKCRLGMLRNTLSTSGTLQAGRHREAGRGQQRKVRQGNETLKWAVQGKADQAEKEASPIYSTARVTPSCRAARAELTTHLARASWPMRNSVYCTDGL
jgi:hypothetical protein